MIDWDKVYDLNYKARRSDTAENQIYIKEQCSLDDFSKGRIRILDCN